MAAHSLLVVGKLAGGALVNMKRALMEAWRTANIKWTLLILWLGIPYAAIIAKERTGGRGATHIHARAVLPGTVEIVGQVG